LIYLKQAQSFL